MPRPGPISNTWSLGPNSANATILRTMLGSIRKFWPSRLFGGGRLARIIHEGFYYNRRYAATTSLTAGGLAAQSVNILFQVCLPPSRLRAPVSLGVSAVSSRTLANNAGWRWAPVNSRRPRQKDEERLAPAV